MTQDSKPTLGFIGLGIMGKPMALNLIKAGYSLTVNNRTPDVMDELVEQGARAAHSAKEVAQNSDIIITMLPDSPQVEEVALGEGGVIEGIKAGALFIDMSSISPTTSRKVEEALKAKGADSLDAPVSGGQVGAEAATLSIMVGGSEEAFNRAKPVFEALGKNIVYIGGAGAGQVTKIANQIVVGLTIQAVSEAMTLAKKAGVDAGKVREALLGGFAQSRILDLHGQRILDGNFKPGFRINLHRKDLRLALETGREAGVPLFATGLAANIMDAMIAQGDGDLDHSSMAKFYAEMSGIE
ncbi:2-hydroxy-3-oxopropionate reductase [Deinococcus detaillensis]|uniref:2-hydroxy-3-oxopropionate reductase n=1 Tax=Deinococcus detaillensis TaxID=2592048 RepID=A0A553V4Z3_9DEIO|nr:2-hydroxy-3-oxopropionate reductase [Deinococcus detaillensis]TSA87512.1 2-hydroxy-3-oxopropionate reductase [Deinococcus detaillensis]